jgi:hypothetical protein
MLLKIEMMLIDKEGQKNLEKFIEIAKLIRIPIYYLGRVGEK